VKYGPANGLFGVALLVGAFAGYKVVHILPDSMSIAGWIAGFVVFGGISFFIQKFYGDRVVFNRIYKTR
jgi:hypothetical protein